MVASLEIGVLRGGANFKRSFEAQQSGLFSSQSVFSCGACGAQPYGPGAEVQAEAASPSQGPIPCVSGQMRLA